MEAETVARHVRVHACRAECAMCFSRGSVVLIVARTQVHFSQNLCSASCSPLSHAHKLAAVQARPCTYRPLCLHPTQMCLSATSSLCTSGTLFQFFTSTSEWRAGVAVCCVTPAHYGACGIRGVEVKILKAYLAVRRLCSLLGGCVWHMLGYTLYSYFKVPPMHVFACA